MCRGNGGVAPVILGGLLQGRSQDPPGNDFRHTFLVVKAFFVTPRFLSSGSDGSERRQVVVQPSRGRCLGFAAVPEGLACQGLPRASPSRAPRWRTFGCSVPIWEQRQRRHAQRCSGGSRSLTRSPASGTNLGAGPPRPKAGLEPLQQTYPWPKSHPRSSVPEPEVCLGCFKFLFQLGSSTCV